MPPPTDATPPRPETTRFAPSPTGYLHLGHALAALVAWQAADSSGGQFLLRIEDIDRTRCRSEFEEALADDLRWLGLTWPEPVWRQSDHFADYAAALDRLRHLGVVYPCFCTRAEIEREVAAMVNAPHGPDGLRYPGTCRALSESERHGRLASGASHAWRLDVARARALTGPLEWTDRRFGRHEAHTDILGDVVLARKDIGTSYHLAVVLDDAAQGVTLVTRGEDLLPCTHFHRLLQALLDLPVPQWSHHPLLCDATGRRLAKRDRSATLRHLRDQGASAEEVRGRLLHALSQMP